MFDVGKKQQETSSVAFISKTNVLVPGIKTGVNWKLLCKRFIYKKKESVQNQKLKKPGRFLFSLKCRSTALTLTLTLTRFACI